MIQRREQARHNTHGRLENLPRRRAQPSAARFTEAGCRAARAGRAPRPPAAVPADPLWKHQAAHLTVSRHGFTCACRSVVWRVRLGPLSPCVPVRRPCNSVRQPVRLGIAQPVPAALGRRDAAASAWPVRSGPPAGPPQCDSTACIKSHAAGASRSHSSSRIGAPRQATTMRLHRSRQEPRRERKPNARVFADGACSIVSPEQGSPCDGDDQPRRQLELVDDARRLVAMNAAAARRTTPARRGGATLRPSVRRRGPRMTR
jgi:hypothetical protein